MHAVAPASAPALSIQAQNHLGHRVASPGMEEEAEPERASSEQTECRQEQPAQREGRMAGRSLGTGGRGVVEPLITEVSPQAEAKTSPQGMWKGGLAGEDRMPVGGAQAGPTDHVAP